MKNNKIMLCLTAAAMLAGTITGAYAASQAYVAGAGVADSPHNINRVAPGGDVYGATDSTQGRTCAYCHTPHHAINDVAEITDYNPLWSHEVAQGNFSPYQSATLNATLYKAGDPLVGPSRLCMSCHDGVIAVDQHYGAAIKNVVKNSGDTWAGIDVGDSNGSTLTNDHPIGFAYDLVQAGGGATADKNGGVWYGIRPLTTTFTVNLSAGKTYNPQSDAYVANTDAFAATYFAGAGAVAGVNRTIQDLMWKPSATGTTSIMTCASCHDVHNKENPESYLLINVQAESTICLTCHNK